MPRAHTTVITTIIFMATMSTLYVLHKRLTGEETRNPKLCYPYNRSRITIDISQGRVLPQSLAVKKDELIHAPPFSNRTSSSINITSVYLIMSHVTHRERRQLIRQTWGKLSNRCSQRIVFVLGIPDVYIGTEQLSATIQKATDAEALTHSDILQLGSYVDGSGDSSTKVGLALLWATAAFPNSSYIAKANDRAWLNVQKFHDFVVANLTENTIFGFRFMEGTIVFRDPNSQFYVSRQQYPKDTYPQYVSGILYAISTGTAKRMLAIAPNISRVPLEDVFWTGFVSEKLELKYHSSTGYEFDYLIDANKRPACIKRDLIAIDNVPPEVMKSYWNDSCHTFDTSPEACV